MSNDWTEPIELATHAIALIEAIRTGRAVPTGRLFGLPELPGDDYWLDMAGATAVFSSLTKAELHTHYDIQGYHVTGLHAVYQVVEHFGLHYGQISYITKMLRDNDLGFYRELSVTGRTTRSGGSMPWCSIAEV